MENNSHMMSDELCQDETWMLQALAIAKKGRYTTTPNPRVGCVILDKNGKKVGEGFHMQAGTPHAEVHALRMAGDKAAGGTAYVTLEPCSHYGRTPPCADALIAASLSRVVVAIKDPFEQVCGRGIAKLENAGIEVRVGVCETQARELIQGFLKRVACQKPFVTLKLAASLDGKTALSNGVSQWITGPEARKDVQRHRAQSCAVLTGSGTVIADDPSLLVRSEQAEFDDYPLAHIRQPLRVIVDSENAVPSNRKMFQDGHPIWLVNAKSRPHIPSQSVSQFTIGNDNGKVDLPRLMLELGSNDINDVWVEGGAGLAGALLEAGEVDQLIVYVAPKILGHHAMPLVQLPDITSLSDTVNLSLVNQETLGQDIKLTYRVERNK